MTTSDVVPAPVRALAELFREALPAVKFPKARFDKADVDVDAESLVAAVAKVDAQQAEVARLELELAAARAALDAGRDELVRFAQRAHAYARVYVEDDELLRDRVDAIALPRVRTPRAAGQGAAAPGASSTSGMAGAGATGASSPTGAPGAEGEAPAKRGRRRAAADAGALFGDAGEAAAAE